MITGRPPTALPPKADETGFRQLATPTPPRRLMLETSPYNPRPAEISTESWEVGETYDQHDYSQIIPTTPQAIPCGSPVKLVRTLRKESTSPQLTPDAHPNQRPWNDIIEPFRVPLGENGRSRAMAELLPCYSVLLTKQVLPNVSSVNPIAA
jgi:hypothetical protein